jgi:myo-inositol-1(or 4)-monophosphatase
MRGYLVADYLAVCEEAARAGGEVLLSWVGRFSVREKGPSDLVTQADLAAQEAIKKVVLGHFPNHHFVGEEDAGTGLLKAEKCWIVDPLDGTTNYVHQVPHYAVSVALAEHGAPSVGVIFDPVSRECFSAVRGEGAYLNGTRLQTSTATDLAQAIVAASFSARVDPQSPEIDQFRAALLNCQAVRRTGSAALNLCYVAAGRFDAFWALSTKAWDVAAGVLLVEEAGGTVSDLAGDAFDIARPHPVTSATPMLHRQFLELLNLAGRG